MQEAREAAEMSAQTPMGKLMAHRARRKEAARTFYVNQATKERTWEKPAALQQATASPEGWISKTDPKSGATFYVNQATKERTWVKNKSAVSNHFDFLVSVPVFTYTCSCLAFFVCLPSKHHHGIYQFLSVLF